MQPSVYANAFESGFGATRRFLVSRGAPLDEAEEIAQAAWVRGWEYRDQLRDPSLVSFWVNSIARNLFRARFRTKLPLPLEAGPEPSYAFDTHALDLRRMLEHCEASDRALLEESLQGYSAEEMSRGTGISTVGIRVRLLRARQTIRRRMELD